MVLGAAPIESATISSSFSRICQRLLEHGFQSLAKVIEHGQLRRRLEEAYVVRYSMLACYAQARDARESACLHVLIAQFVIGSTRLLLSS